MQGTIWEQSSIEVCKVYCKIFLLRYRVVVVSSDRRDLPDGACSIPSSGAACSDVASCESTDGIDRMPGTSHHEDRVLWLRCA